MEFFKKLDLNIYEDLFLEINKMISSGIISWNNNQICINTVEDKSDNYWLGTGSLFLDWEKYKASENNGIVKIEIPPKSVVLKEKDFCVVCDQFKNTVFEDIINMLKCRYTIGRVRLMKLDPKSCLKRVFSIDIDPWCQQYANIICKPYIGSKFESITADMATYEYDSNYPPGVVINTSTEHVSQETYDAWYDNIPKNTLVVVQGNNFFECVQHIRCSKNIENFLTLNKCNDVLFQGELNNPMYTRYMSIFVK